MQVTKYKRNRLLTQVTELLEKNLGKCNRMYESNC